MSELMTDLDWLAATRYPNPDEEWGPAVGRHAYTEDAALTPIFHALTRGGWRQRQHEPAASTATSTSTTPTTPAERPGRRRPEPATPATPDAVDEFRRDPLTAPIPVQAPVSRRRELPGSGRHRRYREGGTARW